MVDVVTVSAPPTFARPEPSKEVNVEPPTVKLVTAAFVAVRFVEAKFVLVALVAVRLLKVAVPLNAGDVANTSAPEPVSSLICAAMPEESVVAVKAPVPFPTSRPVRLVAPVPPLPTGNVLVTSVERSTSAVVTAPAVALRKPESEPIVREPTFALPVVMSDAAFKLPEISAFPATERRSTGDVVPRPRNPLARNVPATELFVMILSALLSVVPKVAVEPKEFPPFLKY